MDPFTISLLVGISTGPSMLLVIAYFTKRAQERRKRQAMQMHVRTIVAEHYWKPEGQHSKAA